MLAERAYALALAECLDNPVASDGSFLGLTDSALAAKALRLFAAARGPAEPRTCRAASGGFRGGVLAPSAVTIPAAETGLQVGA